MRVKFTADIFSLPNITCLEHAIRPHKKKRKYFDIICIFHNRNPRSSCTASSGNPAERRREGGSGDGGRPGIREHGRQRREPPPPPAPCTRASPSAFDAGLQLSSVCSFFSLTPFSFWNLIQSHEQLHRVAMATRI